MLKHFSSFLGILFFTIIACYNPKPIDVVGYHHAINKAELYICKDDLEEAANTYEIAFSHISKPFGKDLFNAALANALISRKGKMKAYLQILINNMHEDDTYILHENFVDKYLNKEEWKVLKANRQINYDEDLRKESAYILERDQWHRPNYETHDDTIRLVAMENLARIEELNTILGGLPAHYELGYPENIIGQDFHLVIHHLTQRRSRDKTSPDFEKLLFNAVHTGRIDPERALFYMKFQNDLEKGWFRIAEVRQYAHPLLHQELQDKVWMTKFDDTQLDVADQLRQKWLAAPMEDVILKSYFKTISDTPFIFTSTHQSLSHFKDDLTAEEVLEQYKIATSFLEELKFDLKN